GLDLGPRGEVVGKGGLLGFGVRGGGKGRCSRWGWLGLRRRGVGKGWARSWWWLGCPRGSPPH
ncbi:hypothetical protein GBA52_027339, partial [Prunus armeniaca]